MMICFASSCVMEAMRSSSSDSLDDRENDLKKRSDLMERKQEDTARLHDEAEALVTKQNTELERIASMTQDEAKQSIIGPCAEGSLPRRGGVRARH